MLILVIRTDNPEAEVGLYQDETELGYETWPAQRILAETVQLKIDGLLAQAGKKLDDIQGIVAYQGPGSFTGLRIGLSVANALAYGLQTPIIGVTGEDWCAAGRAGLAAGQGVTSVMPEYGAPVHITTPKK